jgi:hypothetical protein
MNTAQHPASRSFGFELHFQSLRHADRGLDFPCSATGQVDMDTLSDAVRNDYLFARALMGFDFAAPMLRPATTH